jgi:hypothetical protein
MAALDANPPKPEASAQLRFGGLSGANIDLSDDGRTVSRKKSVDRLIIINVYYYCYCYYYYIM